MLFQWSCPAQLHLDGCQKTKWKKEAKTQQNVTALYLMLSITKVSSLSIGWWREGEGVGMILPSEGCKTSLKVFLCWLVVFVS